MASTTRAAVTPPFDEEHEELRRTLRRFVDTELRPRVAEWEDAQWVPNEVFRRCGELGFLGLKYEERYGGQGGGYLHEAVWAEELARCGSGGLGAAIGAHVNIATPPIWKFGTEEQKERWLVPAIKGEKIGALAITEPDAGSDVAGIKTHAKRVDGGWIVNGSKTFITNGVRADFVVTAVKTKPDGGHRGLSLFVIEKGMDGFVVSRKLDKLGWRASDTAELAFGDVFVPDENLLGEENNGFYLIMANFQWERLGMALGAVAKQRYLLERALTYVNERVAFGRPLAQFQVTRHKIAEVGVRAETGRALTYSALHRFVCGHDALRETAMAKLLTQRDCVRTADDVVQLFGGNGYMTEYGVERALRDARLGPIGGGSDEIMKEILGRQLGL
ncbi:MAG TPA: acyl-CoA dehydrogenase family protein [Thermoleophilaceae bacterium]|nr:acyl-CoA dehydrogenase family protein [Thermoleophilaceae bacterium]